MLFRPLVHLVWLFPGPLVCNLFLFLGLFASMVVSIFLPHPGGTDLIKKAVNTSEKVGWVELLSILPRLTFVGRLDWPSFHKYAPELEAEDVWPAATGLPLSARLATGKSRPKWAKRPPSCT